MSFKSTNLRVGIGVTSSVDILRNLIRLEGQIVNIYPRGYKLSNGIEYLTVVIKELLREAELVLEKQSLYWTLKEGTL